MKRWGRGGTKFWVEYETALMPGRRSHLYMMISHIEKFVPLVLAACVLVGLLASTTEVIPKSDTTIVKDGTRA